MEKFYQKAISVKPEAGLPERIEKFIDGLQGEKPTTGKALFKALLEYAETKASSENQQQNNEELTENLHLANLKIEELEGKLQVLEQSKEENEKETQRLLAENETLKAENERFKLFETVMNQFVTGLQTKLPEVFKAEDESPNVSVDRMAFLINELREQVNTANTRTEEAEAQLETEKLKPATLKPGQAIIGFPPKQLEQIRMLRMLFERMGHKFNSTNAEEVIHYTMDQQIEICRQMVGLCKDYAPLLTILNP